MWFIRALPIVLFALFIDGLQATVSAGLVGVGAIAAAVPVIGWGAGPIGIGVGMAINSAIGLTAGAGLLLLLLLNGSFYPFLIASAFIGEVVPGINNLPFWTVITIMCLLKSRSTEGGAIGAIAGVAVAAASGGVTGALHAVKDAAQPQRPMPPAAPSPTLSEQPQQKDEPKPRAPLLNSEIRPKSASNDTIKTYGNAA